MHLQATALAPGAHGPAQLVSFAGGELGGQHGDLHHLFLNGGTQGPLRRGLNASLGYSTASSPPRRRKYGCTMPPWIGPGRAIATCGQQRAIYSRYLRRP